MPLSEFDIIERYFNRADLARDDVILGIGDDGAVLQVPAGSELVVTVDTLLEGVHFPSTTPASSLGHKALAVSLSDIAAMAATPAWATLSLTFPEADDEWLSGFSQGFFALANQYQVQLVGGDICHGPLSVTVQLHGFVPTGEALRRDRAKAGDLVCVTGTLGDAALALRLLQGQDQVLDEPGYLRDRLDRPQPRVNEGKVLRRLATAAIDISDGLVADLGHILKASQLGATIQIDRLPLSSAFKSAREKIIASGNWTDVDWLSFVLSGGDDYELCFTVDETKRDQLMEEFSALACPVTIIGVVEEIPGQRYLFSNGENYSPGATGYDHFKSQRRNKDV